MCLDSVEAWGGGDVLIHLLAFGRNRGRWGGADRVKRNAFDFLETIVSVELVMHLRRDLLEVLKMCSANKTMSIVK